MTTFISVGNGKKPFYRLLNNLEEVYSLLPKPVIVQRGNTPFKSDNMIIYDFIEQNLFRKYISQSKILIMHGGAGSLIQAIENNKVPIIFPRLKKYDEIIDDHQLELCNRLFQQKKILLVKEFGFLKEEIIKINKLGFDQINKNNLNNKNNISSILKYVINNYKDLSNDKIFNLIQR